MRVSLILIGIAGILMLDGCSYFKKHRLFSKDVDTVLDMTIQEPAPVVADTNPVMTPPVYQEPVQIARSSDRYFMIVGSFQNQNLANNYAEKIRQMGYQSQILEASNGFYRVSAKSYSNFKQGVSEIDDFRSSVAARAWLHIER
jgi:cell division protein FtsN